MDAGIVIVGLGFALAAWDVGRRVAVSKDRFAKVEQRCTHLSALIDSSIAESGKRFEALEKADKNLGNKVNGLSAPRRWGG
jgi:hypothetical protein